MTSTPVRSGRPGRFRKKILGLLQAAQAVFLATLINTVAATAARAAEALPYFVDPSGTPTWTDKPTSLTRQVREFSLALQSWCSSCDVDDPLPVVLAALDSARCGQQCQMVLQSLPDSNPLEGRPVRWLVLNLGVSAGSEVSAQIESAGWNWVEPASINAGQPNGRRQLAVLAMRHWQPAIDGLYSGAGEDHLARQSLPVVLLDSNGWIRGVYDTAQPGEAGRLDRDLARVE